MTDNQKLMLEALENTLGVVSAAAKQAKFTRAAHYKWMKESEEYKAAVDEIQNVAIDFVESQLFKQIKNGNPAATIFYLKTKAKKRGFSERLELSGPDNSALSINVNIKGSKSQLLDSE